MPNILKILEAVMPKLFLLKYLSDSMHLLREMLFNKEPTEKIHKTPKDLHLK